MKLRLAICVFAMVAAGCRRPDEKVPHDPYDLTSFTNYMGRLYDSFSVGMVRSNVHGTIGRPSLVLRNTGPYSNWITDRYIFDPEPLRHYPDIWSGVSVSYSNDVLLSKEHIIRKGQP